MIVGLYPHLRCHLLSFILISFLLRRQIQAVRGNVVEHDNAHHDHVSAMKLETEQSSALAPTVTNPMKKPCLVYAIGRVRSFNDTSPPQKMDFVCWLDAEDRVRNNSFLTKSCVIRYHHLSNYFHNSI